MVQIKIERIDDTDIMIREFRTVFKRRESLLAFIRQMQQKNPPRVWCAQVVGVDNNGGFKRKFLKANVSYIDSNKLGTRGVYCYFNLEENCVYEVSAPLSWRERTRYFLLCANGVATRISREEVLSWFKSKSNGLEMIHIRR